MPPSSTFFADRHWKMPGGIDFMLYQCRPVVINTRHLLFFLCFFIDLCLFVSLFTSAQSGHNEFFAWQFCGGFF